MDERIGEPAIRFLRSYRVVLQGLADGVYNQEEGRKIESTVPRAVVFRALREAVKYDQINTEKLPKEPLAQLQEGDGVFIDLVSEALENSQIMEKTHWSLENVYARRKRVYRVLGVETDYQVAIWKAVKDKKEGRL